jgi:hypothetical protein
MPKASALPSTPPQKRISLKRRTDAGIAALEAKGLKAVAVDYLPTGTVRFHLSQPAETDDGLDRELAEVMAKL